VFVSVGKEAMSQIHLAGRGAALIFATLQVAPLLSAR
jgi:hypothetical protein